jgi:hypothetical protein
MGLSGEDSQDRKGRTGRLEKDSHNRTARKGRPERDNQNGTAKGTGKTGQAEDDRRTLPGQDRQNKTVGTTSYYFM